MLSYVLFLLTTVSTTLVLSDDRPVAFFELAEKRSTNTSNMIILGGGSTGSAGWTGSPVTLSQCNARCASVNTVLFTTCGSYANIFRDQMRCSCSTTFMSQVEICSSCCHSLSYTAQYQELIQVSSACQTLATNGNTTDVAISISYSVQTQYQTVTNYATVVNDYTATLVNEHTATIVNDHTATVINDRTATVVVAGPTSYPAKTSSSASPTATTTSTPMSTYYYTTTVTSTPVRTTAALPTVSLPTVTALSSAMDFTLPTISLVFPIFLVWAIFMATALI